MSTSEKLAQAPGNVVLPKGAANLPSRSVANITRIPTIDQSSPRERIGALPAALLREILDGARFLLEPRRMHAGR